jgi:hypothetical protein
MNFHQELIMSTKWLALMGGLVVGAALLVALPGCEGTGTPDTGSLDAYFAANPFVSDPRDPISPHDLVVTPANIGVSYAGQAITFTVKGGRPSYHWDTVNGNGTINGSPGGGDQAIYQVTTVGDNSIIVYDAQGHSAIAYVTGAATNIVALAPTDITLTNNGALAVLNASGGKQPYNWSVLHGGLGTLNVTTGSSVIYTRSAAGDNAVILTDGNGNTKSAAIHQP